MGAVDAFLERIEVVLFYGPLDGREMAIAAPARKYLAFEKELVVYSRCERTTPDGRMVYDYDYDATQSARKRWVQAHGYASEH